MNVSNRLAGLIAILFICALAFSCASSYKNGPGTEESASPSEPVFVPVEKSKEPQKTGESEKVKKEKPYVISIQEAPKTRFKEEREADNIISINFKSVRLEEAVNMLSNNGRNFHYLIHPDAKRKWVSGFILENVTWQEALEVLLKIHNLKMTREKNLVIITTYEAYIIDLKKKSRMIELEQKYAEMQRSLLSSSLQAKRILGEEQRTLRSFKLKYTQPGEVKKYLEQTFRNMLPKSGRSQMETREEGGTPTYITFSVFPKSSILTAHGSPSLLNQVEKRIAEIDIPQKQVFIESRIVEILRSYTRSLGIQWGGHQMILSDPNTAIVGGAAVGSVITDAMGNVINPGVSVGAQKQFVNFPAIDPAGGGAIAAGLSIQLSNALGTSQLNARLSALEQEGKSKTLSNPKITTINGVTARIESGREIPYQASAGGTAGATTVEFKTAVISLKVTPFVMPDNKINLKIEVKKDDADFTKQVLNVPSILTRRIETSVTVDNGGTAVLGGVFENLKTDTERGVPGLSKIPLLGWLFKGTTRIDDEKELLIFISPRVVKDDMP